THTGRVRLARVHDALERCGYRLDTVDLAEWLARVEADGDDEDRATLAFFDVQAAAPAGVTAPLEVSVAHTLPRLHGAALQAVDDNLLVSHCRYGRTTGFFPPPRLLTRGPNDEARRA
ncbi:MAG TPA: hypothetical protein VM580_21575, partial [Labilithrix sp.]|nr:hypothetical protein [Labilithrix sp.]